MKETITPILNVSQHWDVASRVAIVDADGTILNHKYPTVFEYNTVTKEAKYSRFIRTPEKVELLLGGDGKPIIESIIFENSHLEFVTITND